MSDRGAGPTAADGGPGAASGRCARCGTPLAGRASYAQGGGLRCLPCALRFRPMLCRSGKTSLVVGTVLLAINQGTVLLTGVWPPALAWQIPLTYLVPFCVATWGALGASRQ